MKEKISVKIIAIMSNTLYDEFLTNIEDNGFVLVKYHDEIIRLEKIKE